MKKKIISYGLSAIVLLSVLAMAMPATAVVQMADEFGVNDAIGNQGDYVEVPVIITSTTNGPIQGMQFKVQYDTGVLDLSSVDLGDLTATGWSKTVGQIIVLDTDEGNALPDGSTGSVAILNFSVIGAPGTETDMNITDIIFSNTAFQPGTAPAKNGTFRVDAGAPSVTNQGANPGTIVADGVDETQLNVTVVDDIAVDVVATVDLTQIGGPAEKIMETIGGTLYSTTTTAAIGTTSGTYYLPINATDSLGNYNNTEVFTLIVEAPATGSITGKIAYACNATGIAGVEVNLTDGSVVASTTTDSDGNYTFTEVIPGGYCVNESKSRFWDNSTAVTVTAGAQETVDMTLWLKGDLNNDGNVNVVDLAMLRQAVAGLIDSEWYFDLNSDTFVNVVDLAMLRQAVAGLIVLE